MADSDNTKLSVEEQVARIKAAKEAAKQAAAAAAAAKAAALGGASAPAPVAPAPVAVPAAVATVEAVAPAAPAAPAAPVAPVAAPAPGSVEEQVAKIKAAKAAAAANPTGKAAAAPAGAVPAPGSVEEQVAKIKAAKAAAAANPTGKPAAAVGAAPVAVAASVAAAVTGSKVPMVEPGTPEALARTAARREEAQGATGIDARGTPANKPAMEHLAAAKPGVAKAAPVAAKKKEEKQDGPLPLPESISMPRRPFLGFITMGTFAFMGLFAWLGAVSHMFLRFMFPNVLYESDPKFNAGRRNDYPEAPKVYERYKQDQAVWLVRLTEEGQDRLVALSTVCTHLGCTPNWLQTELKYKCPCHGSGYYMDGVNFEGPTPRPLERFRIFVDGTGNIIVDKSKKYRQDLQQWNENQSFLTMG